mmetsp:Transcript_11381/g.24279  ORF Transcript_11381/g.24279 Transcript_11381/m.24279 type:complete len:203 (-) Transcript_11381:123-731(-)
MEIINQCTQLACYWGSKVDLPLLGIRGFHRGVAAVPLSCWLSLLCRSLSSNLKRRSQSCCQKMMFLLTSLCWLFSLIGVQILHRPHQLHFLHQMSFHQWTRPMTHSSHWLLMNCHHCHPCHPFHFPLVVRHWSYHQLTLLHHYYLHPHHCCCCSQYNLQYSHCYFHHQTCPFGCCSRLTAHYHCHYPHLVPYRPTIEGRMYS